MRFRTAEWLPPVSPHALARCPGYSAPPENADRWSMPAEVPERQWLIRLCASPPPRVEDRRAIVLPCPSRAGCRTGLASGQQRSRQSAATTCKSWPSAGYGSVLSYPDSSLGIDLPNRKSDLINHLNRKTGTVKILAFETAVAIW